MSPNDQLAWTELQAELAEVRQQLYEAVGALPSPLGDLVLAQLQRSLSPLRINIILAAAVGEVDSTTQWRQRVVLAASLEMLHLALAVHQLLLQTAPERSTQELDKSWVGSIILAGDYCFSRSAILAAQTNEPVVVETFAQALKLVSEARLRHLFAPQPLHFDEQRELMNAGLRAATYLAQIAPDERQRIYTVGQDQAFAAQADAPPQSLAFLTELPHFQQARWRAIYISSDREH